MATALAQLAAAQDKNDDHVFLLASQPDSGTINYIELEEKDDDPLNVRANGNWRPLITNLTYPTYTAFDFELGYLYICDCDHIAQYKLTFVDDTVEATE